MLKTFKSLYKRYFQTHPLRLGIVAISFITGIFLLRFFTFSHRHTTIDESYRKHFQQHYKVFAINIPENIEFSGEAVPIHDFDVRERLDRELLINTYWQSQTLLWIKRSNRWLPLIAEIIRKNNIPDDFKYLALVESGFTHQVSPKGAAGYWQFIESTAKSYGLQVNEEIDERYHIEKATEAACKYFKEAYKTFNNWTLVAASYNMGINGLQRQLERQKVNSFYDLLLNDETSRYVFRILAAKEIVNRPDAYGFKLRKKDLYPGIPFQIAKVDTGIGSMQAFADKAGYSFKLIKLLNPWIRSDKLSKPDEKKPYMVKMPKGDVKNYQWLLEQDPITNQTEPDTLMAE